MNSWREWGIRNSFLYDKYGFKKEKFQSYSKTYGKKKKRKLSLYIFEKSGYSIHYQTNGGVL